MAARAEISSGHAKVNGLSVYYEIHGSGEPLVLLHGGAIGIVMFGPTLPALARHRKVIAIELQGHGRTSDGERPITFEAMADDVDGVMQHLGVATADVMGYSLGAGTALQVAIRHPDRVRRLIVVSEAFRRSGWYPEVLQNFDHMGPEAGEGMKQSPLVDVYPDVDWNNLFGKLGELLRQDYDWKAEVAAIRAPVLLVFSDADGVRLDHIAEFFGLFGGGKRDAGLDASGRPSAQLAIIPGTTHYNVIESPLVPAVVEQFLSGQVSHAGVRIEPG